MSDLYTNHDEEIAEVQETEKKKSLVEKFFDIDGLLKKMLPEKMYTTLHPLIESGLFVFWGVVTTLIGLLFYHGVLLIIGETYYKYVKIAQMIFSKVLSYVCNKFGVFKTTENKKSENVIEMALFIITRGLIMVIDYFLLIIMVQKFGLDEVIANYAEFPIIVAINYITGKTIVYNRKVQIFLRKLFTGSKE